MRVLFVSAEVFPLAKSGGLADVSAALPAALSRAGADVRVLMPAYPQALGTAPGLREILQLGDPLGCGETRLLETVLPGSNLPVWLVDSPSLFNRGGGLYQDHSGGDWSDNHLRFALLNHVAAGIANEAGGSWQPDILHANDWHAGLAPRLLAGPDRRRPSTVFTIHNLAYQGQFDAREFFRLGLPADAYGDMEFYGRISFLKAGIRSADALTTVSPTYAREILTGQYGCGLDGLLRERADRLTGILNGVDYDVWDPSIDPHLVCNYTVGQGGKTVNKKAVQEEMGLEIAADKPLMAFMSRLVHQKMPEIVAEALPQLVEDGMQFALVADGEHHYAEQFRQLAARYPGRVAVQIGYREAQAHRLLAGADMLVHPSRFEPCGLVPIYALRYGTVPLVRRSGGLADSVVDAGAGALHEGSATGFSFADESAAAVVETARRAHALYRQPVAWRRLRRAGMQQDFGWARSAAAYLDLYRSLLSADPADAPDDPIERLSA